VARLRDEGVEMSVIAPLMESFELLAISSALQTVGGVGSAAEREEAYGAEDSIYQQAQQERGLSNDELFEVVCAAVIASVESAVHLKETRAAIGTAFAAAAAPVPAAPAAPAPKARRARSATAGKTTVDQPAAVSKTAPRGKTAAARKTVASKGAADQPAAAAKATPAPRKPAAKATAPARKPAAAAKTTGTPREPASRPKSSSR
jgi:hypothetical protein